MLSEDYKKYYKVLEVDQAASLDEIKTAYFHLRNLYSADSMLTPSINGELSEAKRREILAQVIEAYEALSGLMASPEPGIPPTPPVSSPDAAAVEPVDNKESPVEADAAVVVEPEIADDIPFKYDEDDTLPEEMLIFDDELPDVSPLEDMPVVELAPEEPVDLTSSPGIELKEARESLGLSLNDLWQLSEIPYKTLEDLEIENFSAFPEAGYLRWCVTVYARYVNLDTREIADEYMKRYRKWQKDII